MTGAKIMVVEDDLQIQELISLYLISHGFLVVQATDGISALTLFEQELPQLVLLDIQLPGIQGYHLCSEIRSLSNVPIIFISCNTEPEDIMKGLELGADDYVTKPFDPNILVARVKANLRRAPLYRRSYDTIASSRFDNRIKYDGFEIDLASSRVTVNGNNVHLSAKEMQLLTLLAQNPNQIYTPEELYMRVWGTDSNSDTRTVIVHISSLRKKLETEPNAPSWIQNVRGVGYKFRYGE